MNAWISFQTVAAVCDRRSARMTTLGQSLSGCFVLDTFLTGTSNFQGFVAMDPCLWWGDGHATKIMEKLPAGSGVFDRALFLAFSGTDEAGRRNQQTWFDRLSDKDGAAANRLRFAHYAEESHISMNLKGFYEGLNFVFGPACGLAWGDGR